MRLRQQALLALIGAAPSDLTRTELVKLAFLVEQSLPSRYCAEYYEFVPYRYGPFSFEMYRDLQRLVAHGWLQGRSFRPWEGKKGALRSHFAALPDAHRSAIEAVLAISRRLRGRQLLDYVYRQHPWYASRSELAPNPSVHRAGPTCVYTIGYEGETVDGFMNRLLRLGIVTLADVRSFPMSRKYGFARRRLSRIAQYLGIRHIGYPELGIPSVERKNLVHLEDRVQLFAAYARSLREKRGQAAAKLALTVQEAPTAIVCFERDPSACHRGQLAEWLCQRTGLPVRHLSPDLTATVIR